MMHTVYRYLYIPTYQPHSTGYAGDCLFWPSKLLLSPSVYHYSNSKDAKPIDVGVFKKLSDRKQRVAKKVKKEKKGMGLF